MSLTSFDLWTRAVGLFGSGCFFGCTFSTSTVLIPIILRDKTISNQERLALWDDQFTLSVVRWTPTGIAGALSYLLAAYHAHASPGAHGRGYDSAATLYWAGGAMLAMIPLTVVFIFPVVGKLKNLRKQSETELKGQEAYIERTIAAWDARHRGRILCSGACFLLGIYDMVRLLQTM